MIALVLAVFRLDRPGPPAPPGMRCIDLCPADTVFVSITPSAYRLYTRFLRDHQTSLSSSVVSEATLYYGRHFLDVTRARLQLPDRYQDVGEALAETAPDDLFFAMVAGSEPGGPLDYIAGGRTVAADVTALAFRKVLSSRIPNLRWDERAMGPFKLYTGTPPAGSPLYLVAWDRWLLCASRLDTLQQALDRRGQGASLATSPVFLQALRNNGYSDDTCLFLVYTDVARCRALLGAGPSEANKSLARRLEAATPWLSSVSWAWHADPTRETGTDRLFYGLAPPAAGWMASWPSLSPRPFIRGATVVCLPVSVPRDALNGTPLEAWVERLGLTNDFEAAFVVDVPADGPPRTCWMLALPDARARLSTLPAVEGTFFSATDSFLVVASDPESATWFSTGERGGPPRLERFPDVPTADGRLIASLYYDTQAIARRYAALARHEWAPLRAALAARGMELGTTPPDLDPSTLYRGARIDVRAVDGGLLVENVIRRGASTSTYFSAAGALAAQAYGPEIWRALDRLAAAAAVYRVDRGGARFNATKFVVAEALGTYILFVPNFQEARGMTVLGAVTAFVYTAALPRAVP